VPAGIRCDKKGTGIPDGARPVLRFAYDQDLRVPAGLFQMNRFLNVVGVADAVRESVKIAPATETETVPVEQSAGRALAAGIEADTDIPGFDRSVVDGYAVRSADTTGAGDALPALLPCVGRVAMGTSDS